MDSADSTRATATGDGETLSEGFARFLAALTLADIPEAARAVALRDPVDAAGLCLAARNQTYIQQVIDGWDSDGPCTALGQSRALDAAGAALVNGVAIPGEDFADTLEGAPIRVGAMGIPAVRSEERRVGQGGGRTCRSWWSPYS